ncbi:MAG: hypothetical protein RLZZ255_1383 [Cyanobacteriota bacterium]|jgi:uncharacterized protein YgbK (DUF1537 family)
MAERRKVIVLDDDPTGSQTVHSAPLLLRWDPDSLRRGLRHPSPLLFVLANTRALEPEAARERVREICRGLRLVLAELEVAGELERWLVVSRGDSTLRGHFPLEVEAIQAELGPFDATLLAPAFLPGGRTTRGGVHYLHGQPVHTTDFARDRLFGFSSSFLPEWVAEKTRGAIPATSVERLDLAELDGSAAALQARVDSFSAQRAVAVDAEQPEQLAALGEAVWRSERRLLFQSAASLINGLVPLPPQPLDPAGLAALRRCGASGERLPVLVVVGSHVPLADQQLELLLQEPACEGVEILVAKLARVLDGPAAPELIRSLERSWLEQLQAVLDRGRTPVLFSSRGELVCASVQERRRFGLELAALMARLAAALAPQLGLIISKGGITTHTLLADGLGLDWVELQGQLLPGLSVVLTPADAKVSGLPVITFPGNLGDASGLRQAWQLMLSD